MLTYVKIFKVRYRTCIFYLKDNMDDWEAIAHGGSGTGDMMIVNLPQLNAAQNFDWVMSTSPSSPIQSPSSYGVGQAANSATSFVSSLIRGFTGGNSPSNASTVYEPFTSPKK